jgi:signal transduction histidine kinase/two-component SAPR family response regulator
MAERSPKYDPQPIALAGAGEMGSLMQTRDWSTTPIGRVEGWPQSLRTAVSILLTSRFAMWLGWGPELTFLYNDAYAPTLGVKHPWALGRPSREVWAEIWEDIQPRIDRVLRTGEATWDEALLLFLERRGFSEETYHTFSYSPLRNDDGKVMGHLCVVSEETERVIGERRLRLLRELAATIADTRASPELFAAAADCLAARHDLPFSLTYLFDEAGKIAQLACASGFADRHPAAPASFAIGATDAPWPADRVLRTAAPVIVQDLAPGLDLPKGPWGKPPSQAIVLPIAHQGQTRPAGVFVAGINPHRPFDGDYQGFLSLVAGQIGAGLAAAQAYQIERRRAEALAEIDRAKTTFFSNASHEFRTPLTLLLSPIEDLLLRSGNAPSVAADRAEVELMHRNGLRLLKLVNTLLDFSRIEAGRFEAVYEPVDLADFTTELASTFRSAMSRAGLRYVVDCQPLAEPVFVARDMWEKIVLNLLSNAFKYTLEGEVVVALRPACGAAAVELTVRDTGVGIPIHELPRLFERFHRVEGQLGRTQEGTGIGLALVNELVRLHGGNVTAESVPGQGSMFTVTIPTGSAHLPADRIGGARLLAATDIRAEAFVEEALRWLDAEIGAGSTGETPTADPAPSAAGMAAGGRSVVLLADDNADMRDYVRRLLADHYEVVTVANGATALDEARRRRPDLILSDVMMPLLDGFGLLQAVRNEPELREVPFILLSARAGEEARVDGMTAGADDYLTKPFAARELLARVRTNMEMARLRRESAETLRARTAELETLLETVPAGVWFTSDPDASRVWGNRHAAALLRLASDANPSLTAPEGERPWHFRMFRGDAEADPRSLPLQRAARGEEVRGDEIEIRFEDGGSLALLAHAAPVRDSAGRVVGAICAGIDITTRKHAEAALRRFNETLEERVVAEIERRRQAESTLRQAQKMEAIGQLTGGVAHDMNNLLLVIQGNLEILERQLSPGSDGGDRRQRAVRAALAGVERAASLTQRLLAFARRQPLDPKPVEPDRLVAGMSDLLRRTLGETIAIETRLTGGLWRTFVDPNQLENAILNLAVNARDAMPEGGRLTLETLNNALDADDLGQHAEVISGDYVMIAVSDTGTGMTREAVERAFEPFFTTKDVGKGTGLGLSQVYGFVKQSGGHVELDSAIGLGTTVRIYLPRYRLGRDQPASNGAAAAVAAGSTGESVLVVEDNDEVRASTIDSLSELGYRVLEASDAAEALRRLEAEPSIRLLFTDIGLPEGMNGRQLADAAQRLRPSLRVLFTTGYASREIIHDGRIDHGVTLIQKPFTYAALAEKVRAALDDENTC